MTLRRLWRNETRGLGAVSVEDVDYAGTELVRQLGPKLYTRPLREQASLAEHILRIDWLNLKTSKRA